MTKFTLLSKIATIILLFISFSAFSQGVSIKNTSAAPNSHSILDIDDSNNNKGILIPRVTTAERTNNTAGHFNLGLNEEGLTVYDTDTDSYWLWDGAAWKNFSAGGGSGWGLTGNAGTVNGTNFIGTTDNVALDIRTNNQINLTIGTSGQIGTIKSGSSVFIGYSVGYQAVSSVLIGFGAAYSLTGANNVVIGRKAMEHGTTGQYNIALGYESMGGVRDGDNNIGIGYHTSGNSRHGDNNISIGTEAGWDFRPNAAGNVLVGCGTGENLEDGHNNTAIGYLAYDCGSWGEDFTNSTAIGYQTSIGADNQIHLGNSSITEIKGQVSFSTYSDGRIKDNVTEDVKGLEFIKKLRPVTYNLNKHKQDKIMGIVDNSTSKSKYDIEKIKFSGFIAQEVEQAANNCGYDFSGINKPKKDGGLYGLKYADFVVPLVKAMQEQQKQIEELKKEIKKLQNK